MQFETRMDDLILSNQKKNENQEIASLKKQVTEIECKMGEDL